MQRDWFMYHLRSTYKNRLEYPFNDSTNTTVITEKQLISLCGTGYNGINDGYLSNLK